MEEENNNFDFDAGVADIAEGLGLGIEEVNELTDQNEETTDDQNKLSEDAQKKTEESKQSEEQQQQPAVREAPKSWAKEHHETWNALPDPAKDYIELREKQMLDGIEQYKAGHQYGYSIAQTLAPYAEDFKQAGVDEITGIKALMEHHRAITQGTLEQRQQAFIKIGIESGLIPSEGQPRLDPQVQTLRQEIEQLKQFEQTRQQQFQQQTLGKITNEVDEFAKQNEHFEALADDMVPFLKMGMPLKDAYEKALWANPVTRAKEIQKQNAFEIARKQKEAEAAKKAAAVNIRPQRSRNDNQPAGSWDDTMAETLRSIKNR